MAVAELKTLAEIWARRQSDRVGVMNLAEKEAYLILNCDKGSFETFSSKHGILNLHGQDAEAAQWIEWSVARQIASPESEMTTDSLEQSSARQLH